MSDAPNPRTDARIERFRKKPLEIEARQLDWMNADEILDALPDPDKLDYIAEHLDITDGLWIEFTKTLPGHEEGKAAFIGKEMQTDLKRWANEIRAVLAEVDALEAHDES